MTRRVKQSDGSYCYTENCRIHDRSFQDSTGRQAVIADLRESQRSSAVATATQVLTEAYGDIKGKRVAEEAIHSAVDSSGNLDPYNLATVLAGTVRNADIQQIPGSALTQAHEIYNRHIQQAAIRQGDEVIINETGERGTITEGDTRFGGVVRFNPENTHSRNSFAWFPDKDLTKIMPNEEAPAREQILGTPRDGLFPVSLAKRMLNEESATRSRNPQAAREFGKNARAAKDAYAEIGNRIETKYKDRNMSRRHLVKILDDEYQQPMPGKSEAEVRAVKSGLRNIINYLDPTY